MPLDCTLAIQDQIELNVKKSTEMLDSERQLSKMYASDDPLYDVACTYGPDVKLEQLLNIPRYVFDPFR